MITIRYTEPLARRLGLAVTENDALSRSFFAEWYGGAVESDGDRAIVFVNSASRLAVVTPLAEARSVELLFQKRVLALYRQLGLPDTVLRHETEQVRELAYGPATSRSVIETLQAVSRLLPSARGGTDSFEIAMSEVAQPALNFRTPAEVARAIVVQHLSAGWSRAG